MGSVNEFVSDLFFNHDVSWAVMKNKKGEFSGFDSSKLLIDAQEVLVALKALGVKSLPSA